MQIISIICYLAWPGQSLGMAWPRLGHGQVAPETKTVAQVLGDPADPQTQGSRTPSGSARPRHSWVSSPLPSLAKPNQATLLVMMIL